MSIQTERQIAELIRKQEQQAQEIEALRQRVAELEKKGGARGKAQ